MLKSKENRGNKINGWIKRACRKHCVLMETRKGKKIGRAKKNVG